MEDYNTCKMYIIFDDNWDCYIGHTIQTLKRRLGIHLSADKTVSTMINPEIFLLEDYPCNNLLEARMREQCWLDTFPTSINKYRAYINEEMKKESSNERGRLWYLNNKEKNKESSNERSRLWKLNNKEKIKEQSKLRYLNNKEKVIETQRLYKLNNKEKISEKNKLRYLKNKELKNKIDTLIPPSE